LRNYTARCRRMVRGAEEQETNDNFIMQEIKRNKIWSINYIAGDFEADSAVKEIAEATGLSEICARLIRNRGFKTPDQAKKFLNNEEAILHDPYLLKDIVPAIERIKTAIEAKETIAIYGDYDVDGVTSVSMLYLYLNAQNGGKIGYYIPSREGEGYGLSKGAIDKLAAKGVNLIITVDTGITAYEEAIYAKSLGIDMVVTDHHECREELPECCAVVNPHRHDCTYPFTELAGVGVVFKLICAYEIMKCREIGESDILGVRRICNEYADLVAIGTIADVMPIIDENRLIVTLGLSMISNTKRLGLAALIDAANAPANGSSQAPKKRKITSGFIGYGIAPRINAAGRISTASKAVELLLADTEDVAKAYAEELCEINRQRQIEENRIADQAYKTIEKTFDPENDRVIVIEDDNWQHGIIGIVASRITEKYGLPSLLISFDGATRGYPSPDDVGKGSGRSIKGMNLVNAMNSCADLLCKYGGHELAAGLTIERDKIDKFRKRINEYAKEVLNEENLIISLEADCELSLNEVTMDLVKDIYKLEPFGVANPVPQFVLRNLTVDRINSIGNGKHTKLVVSQNGISLSAVYFGMSAAKLDVLEGEKIDLLVTVDINEYQNVKSVQLIVQDHKLSEDFVSKINSEKRRFEEIRAGGSFLPEENIIPDRNDFVSVYTLLRREAGGGKTQRGIRHIMAMLRQSNSKQRKNYANQSDSDINYIKLKFIILIMYELRICGVEQLYDDMYEFDMYFNTSKTNIDKSSILKRLRGQCKNL